ncbi:MAG: radical SAM protein [Phycisphaerae bacterium]|nr:radical SAM protein [Phycisphaerae bacterium]
MLSRLSCAGIGVVLDRMLPRFPPTVRIETTNACNAQCVICPHRRMQRPIVTMGDALFEKIIDQCADHGCRTVHLHNFGEPLLDKRLPDRIRYAKAKGLSRVAIFSNGSLLAADMAERLIAAGLDEIKISFDGATREEFEQIRIPLRFDAIVANIKHLIEIRNARKARLKIRIACNSTSNKSGTMQFFDDSADGFSFGRVHNWADAEVESVSRTSARKPCSRVWRTFTILADGSVALCCLDYEGKVALGSAAETPIEEIWHSDSYRRIRHWHKTARQCQISICGNCSKSFW